MSIIRNQLITNESFFEQAKILQMNLNNGLHSTYEDCRAQSTYGSGFNPAIRRTLCAVKVSLRIVITITNIRKVVVDFSMAGRNCLQINSVYWNRN